ncbi:hypothetical protein L2E82_25875 [Cichorium intybus]|uniref:Uncharacterized protein n=1 Tax=Cichorium intybus TaxID=13427 RepID=A0ACB9E4U6_CICIN|nr:hypothetical protein L2E82_25875 [Cichorium intybus]
MEIDPLNPLLRRHHASNRALIQKYFDLEVEFMVIRGYSEQQKFIEIRSSAISKIGEYTSDRVDPLVPFLAITYVDRFLSKNLNIPVVLRGQGFEENLKLFVFCCVSMALKIRCSDFSFVELLNKHQVAEERDLLVMELQILEGLRWKVRPVTAITFIHFFLPLLNTQDQKQFLPINTVSHIIVSIQKDVRFTEFRPSTLAASAILVSSFKLLPELYSEFSRTILRTGLLQQSEVDRCVDELKEHIIPDHILLPDKCPMILKETHKWGLRQEKEKEQLIENSTVENAAQPPVTSEITKEEEDKEKMAMGFDRKRVDPEPRPRPVKVERYGPMQLCNSLFWPMVMKCFGLEFGSRDSN